MSAPPLPPVTDWLTWSEIRERFPDRWVCLEVSRSDRDAYPFARARVCADLEEAYHLCEEGHDHFYTREAPAGVMGKDHNAWLLKKYCVLNPLALAGSKENAARRNAGVGRGRGYGTSTIVVGLDGERGADGHRLVADRGR